MGSFPNPQLARQWAERLARFEHCDQSVARFCRNEDCFAASFYHWRKRLGHAESAASPAFVPVGVSALRVDQVKASDIRIEFARWRDRST